MMSKEEKERLLETIRTIHDLVFEEGYKKGYEAGLKEKENNMAKIKKIDINDTDTALLYDDFKIIRHAKIGDIVTLSDGKQYQVSNNTTQINKKIGRSHV